MEKGADNKIYLIGSYHGFRDGIIKALSEYTFADPRKHRQSSTAKLVCDDLKEAEECPIALAVFPKGKSRGVMSYVEIGVSFTNGNHLIVVDEGDSDPLLKRLADNHFNSLDAAIDYLKGDVEFNLHNNNIESKYPPGTTEPVPLNSVLITGTITEDLETVVRKARKKRPDREFIIVEDTYKEFMDIAKYDLVVANFSGLDWDRNACLIMGAAFAHDISIFIMDDHELKYPPLQAVARRHGTVDSVLQYITEVDDLNLTQEARNMYEFFIREQERKSN